MRLDKFLGQKKGNTYKTKPHWYQSLEVEGKEKRKKTLEQSRKKRN